MKGKGYAKFEQAWIQRLLQNPLVALSLHWIFQSLFYMDKTERLFKLSIDAVLFIILFFLFQIWVSYLFAFLIAFLLAHTLNFLLNGHLWGVLKHYGYVENTYEDFVFYTEQLAKRVNAEKSISYAAVYGSCVRSEWKPTSDLDVRVIRDSGLKNGIQACWYCMKERTHAFLNKFPLDIYVLDTKDSLTKLRETEVGSILKDDSFL